MSFKEKDTLFQINPFLKGMLERTLNFLLPPSPGSGRKGPEGGTTSSIVLP
jgi:hypothetical protein